MCGIAGVFGVTNASRYVLAALRAQQTRGTAAAGIAANINGEIINEVHAGVVHEAFPGMHILNPYPVNSVIGHVRYPTRGATDISCAQPFVVGKISHCSNGDIPNYEPLRLMMEKKGYQFSTKNDSELITIMLHFMWEKTRSVFKAVKFVMENVKGTYSSLGIINNTAVAFRDPWGVRPMVLGQLLDGWIVASETVALDEVGAKFIRPIDPGELLIFNLGSGKILDAQQVVEPKPRAFCFFERVYFSQIATVIFNQEVAAFRRETGKQLAREDSLARTPDLFVMPVPDSGTCAAEGYAWEAGLHFAHGFIRRHHKGRTFIEAGDWEEKVRAKFSFLRSILENSRIILIDDSIVRGSTMRVLVKLLREHGVKEIHVRPACPPIIGSCYYGIDTARRNELLAYQFQGDIEKMRQYIGADSLQFLSLKGLKKCLGNADDHCLACVTGEYPIP